MLPFLSSVSYFLSLAQRLAQRLHWEDKESALGTPFPFGGWSQMCWDGDGYWASWPQGTVQALVWMLGAHHGHLAHPPRFPGSSRSPPVSLKLFRGCSAFL